VHKLDPYTLFSIFEQGDEEIYKENNVEDVLKNPYVLIGMVVTGVENYHYINKMYSLKHPEHYKRVKGKIKYKYYNKLYNYLNRVSPLQLDIVYKIGDDFEIDRSLKSIYDLLFYFQDIEDYNKCKIIKEYADLLMDRKLETLI
jgi:hypothetical protein|tara:strand:- start:2925 stop:3356 length:432 start_codon:yes stop_codon:yes gene_type:complete